MNKSNENVEGNGNISTLGPWVECSNNEEVNNTGEEQINIPLLLSQAREVSLSSVEPDHLCLEVGASHVLLWCCAGPQTTSFVS